MNDSGIIGSYQAEKELELPQPEAARLATVDAVGTNGLRLIFDGETASDGKYYRCNPGLRYQTGNRVLVQSVGGSYVVVCKIGAPTNDLYGYYRGPISWEMKDADGTLASATSRINRIIDLLQEFGIAY